MLTQRSTEKEWLDLGPNYYTAQQYRQCLRKLFLVNKMLGFFRDTITVLKQFSPQATVVDVGCGGGLFLLHLSRYFPEMQLLGIDISKLAIEESQQALEHWQHVNPTINVRFQLQSAHELPLASSSVDVILLTLVCHHLTDDELISFLQQAQSSAQQAVIINDLHRHQLASWLYAMVSPLLFRDHMITHDGLISIRRGFTRADWHLLLQKAGMTNYQLKWRLPFRWQLILWK